MTSDPVKHILSQFGKRQMTTTPQSLAENEGVAANVEDPRVAAIAEAMRQKRKDLIHQPLAFIWDDLARAALSALRSRDSVIEDCARIADSYSRGEDNFAECACRIRELAQAPAPEGPKIVSARLIPWEPGMQGVDLTLSDGLRVALPLTAALSSHAETAGMVSVPKAALDWLFGEGPDADGHWFGDGNYVEQVKRPLWWRSKFRAMIKAAKGGEM